jgi:imidazolonepropionase-like amidohydrolase
VEANLRAYLYAGVTTVLDPADPATEAAERRDRVAAGQLIGPRIYTAGRLLTAPGGHPIALMNVAAPWWIRWYLVPRVASPVGTPDQAIEAVNAQADAGVDFIKVVVDRIPDDVPRMDVATLQAAVDAARARGLRTLAHVGDVRDALDTGRAGVAAWMHVVYKERIPDQTIAELAAFGIPMVPTLTVWQSYASVGRGDRVATRLERETESADVLAAFNQDPGETDLAQTFGPYLDLLRANRPFWAENVKRLHDAGVTILAGSDTQSGVLPGAGLHRELALLHAAGLSRAEVIRAATLDAARFVTGQDDPDFGSVEVGQRADLMLVEGNPLDDLDALAAIREVIVAGIPLQRTPVGEGSAAGG